MTLSLIACVAANRVIGRGSEIPWRVPGEQKIFRRVTSGHTVVMGRKTYESIGRPLPKRTNIVVTRQADYDAPGCTVVGSLDAALAAVPDDETETFIIGGGQLYVATVDRADRIYLSELSKPVEGDVTFPDFDKTNFRVVSSKKYPDADIPYVFTVYEREGPGTQESS